MTAPFYILIVIAVFQYTAIDIKIWQRIFEANNLQQVGAGLYHAGWQEALYGFMVLGAIALINLSKRHAVLFPLALYALAHSGLQDVLYYWLDFRALPAELPWLNEAPLILFSPVASGNLIASALIWLVVVVVAEYVIRHVQIDVKWL